MRKLSCILSIIVVVPMVPVHAEILIDNTTRNGSFESGPSAKTMFTSGAIPDWTNWTEVDAEDDDTGTDLAGSGAYTGLDGTRIAWLQPGAAILNMTAHVIQAGDVIDYSVWNVLAGRTGDAEISLVWDNAGTRTAIPGTEVVFGETSQGVGQFTVQAGDAWIGSILGVGIVNLSGNNYPELDQVALSVDSIIIKPSDPVMDLVITGPISGGTQMVLSWTGENNGSYSVETNSTLDLLTWQSFMTGISGTGGTLYVTNSVSSDQTFYRVITE